MIARARRPDYSKPPRYGGEPSFFAKAERAIDMTVRLISPKAACRRAAYRFSYDAIDSHRTRKKRGKQTGSGDTHLSETNLFKLREINRELCRNNPLIEGMFETERDGTIGDGVTIQARTGDKGLNEDLEAAWQEEMIDKACDVTGCHNFDSFLGIQYLSYRRDGDSFTLFVDDQLQGIEGEQVGTPFGRAKDASKHFEVVNGLAFSNKTKRKIGYYIGESDRKRGFIKANSWKNYAVGRVHQMFNPRRFSQSRGKPALASAIDFIDKLCGYVDAELVAAKVNACFSMFISQEYSDLPDPYTEGVSSTGLDEDGNRLEKMEPGRILYGGPDDKATGIGQQRPGSLFDPFVRRILTFIGRPMCMPLMLITLDFAGATFMNARIAYQKIQDAWMREQKWVVKPYCSRVWRWKIGRLIEAGLIKTSNPKPLRHEIMCKRWPYVDPYKESNADKVQLANKTITRTAICARQGTDFGETVETLALEKGQLEENDLVEQPATAAGDKAKGD